MSVEKDKEKSTSKYDKARMKRKEQIKLSWTLHTETMWEHRNAQKCKRRSEIRKF